MSIDSQVTGTITLVYSGRYVTLTLLISLLSPLQENNTEERNNTNI
ncbi:MAG TPA: hypothetical protein VKX33_00770 [Cyclobacteriaceae bacterium]|nr:hypothetical protein [Cyclobacteriaceae bacterium]